MTSKISPLPIENDISDSRRTLYINPIHQTAIYTLLSILAPTHTIQIHNALYQTSKGGSIVYYLRLTESLLGKDAPWIIENWSSHPHITPPLPALSIDALRVDITDGEQVISFLRGLL